MIPQRSFRNVDVVVLLLWALEEMAWHTQYLTRTAMILTKLAQSNTLG